MSDSKPSIILVTGATGFLGSHVVLQLLEKEEYSIRAVVRNGEGVKLKSIFPTARTRLEVVEVESLTDDISGSLEDVEAVIHCASPAYFKSATAMQIFESVYYGTLNVVSPAMKLKIKKIIVTGSFVSMCDAKLRTAYGTKMITENDWGDARLDNIDLTSKDTSQVYREAKCVSEKSVWALAKKFPGVDVTTIIAPVILGPYVPNFPLPDNRVSLATHDAVYTLITNGPTEYPNFSMGHLVDVRDVAKAHVLALTAPPANVGKPKRLIVCSKIFTWKETVDMIRERRPELERRLPGPDAVGPVQTSAPVDMTLTKEVLGLTESDYIPWDITMIDTVDQMLEWERVQNMKLWS
ncbi:hypothetical protein C8J56DRAFT_893530 [Mycena floridula]|nr:hypothetical protein C8J56DRAFT_893530 [Mycena floridula]